MLENERKCYICGGNGNSYQSESRLSCCERIYCVENRGESSNKGWGLYKAPHVMNMRGGPPNPTLLRKMDSTKGSFTDLVFFAALTLPSLLDMAKGKKTHLMYKRGEEGADVLINYRRTEKKRGSQKFRSVVASNMK